MSNPKKSILLDVDPSIIERNVTIVKDWTMEDEFKNIIRPPDATSTTVKPSPGFCIKTKVQNENKKVFINVCHTDAIPPPDDIGVDELVRILSSDEPSSYRVPMSIGEPRSESDKSGQSATAYDVAVGTAFLKKIEGDETFRTFFINVAFEGVQNKFDVELDADEYVILKNRKSVGNLQSHRIQKRIVLDERPKDDKSTKALIEEIDSSQYDRAKDVKQVAQSDESRESQKPIEKSKNIEFELTKKTNRAGTEFLVGEFKIKQVVKCSDIILDLGEDRLIVEIPKYNRFQDTFLPCNVKQNSGKAFLDAENNLFYVIMEVAK